MKTNKLTYIHLPPIVYGISFFFALCALFQRKVLNICLISVKQMHTFVLLNIYFVNALCLKYNM